MNLGVWEELLSLKNSTKLPVDIWAMVKTQTFITELTNTETVQQTIDAHHLL